MNTQFDYLTNDDIVINEITESDEEDLQHELNDKPTNLNYNIFNRRAINFSHTNQQSLPNQANLIQTIALKSVDLIPSQFRNIFASFPYFNRVQSTVFDDVVYTDKNLVISAPTSSGKTVLLELAIIRLLTILNYTRNNSKKLKFKIIYMAPLKALCSEKHNEWVDKFEKLHGLKCIELTGDTENENETNIENSNIICTTPEKWDVMTRKWKNRHLIMSTVKLMLIDEIHVLGENTRGATIEAVISRMKLFSFIETSSMIRFIAISATIPNIDDIATWLSSDFYTPATVFKLNETFRPVKLVKIVHGYHCAAAVKDFNFDLSLNYKISGVIEAHSEGKPTLIFCSTRKGTVQAAQLLAKTSKYIKDPQHKQTLNQIGQKVKDPVLTEMLIANGIGYHHAGMDSNDRHAIENLFLNGHLLVLFSTSTLAIGINLPAHLVIIKSTMYYSNQSYIEYSTSQILQMIGRAGRPQFDTSATAVIMTKAQDKQKYESLVEGHQLIESQLHLSLIEHLNVEIVLQTIINLNTAINWLKSTFLYARIKKNPQFYGVGLDKTSLKLTNENRVEHSLKELCIKNLNDLMECNLIEKFDLDDPASMLKPTMSGQLMARYCTAFDTMRLIITNLRQTNDSEDNTESFLNLETLISLISESKELEDIKLRTNEKSILNGINNNGKIPKEQMNKTNIVRYVQPGKIKTNAMKTNVLIQAQFGSIALNDFSLSQDTFRIFRVGQRISRCLFEYQMHISSQDVTGSTKCQKNYLTFLNSVILYKNFITKLWFDSPHLFKQFNRIGTALSQALVNANVTSFEAILKMNPRVLERTLNKNPPFGNIILETIEKLTQFKIEFSKDIHKSNSSEATIDIICKMDNYDYISSLDNGGCLGLSNQIMLIVGDEHYNLLFANRLNNNAFLNNNGLYTKKINLVKSLNGFVVHASLVLLQFVGLDVHETFNTFELSTNQSAGSKKKETPKTKTIRFQNETALLHDDYLDDVFNDEVDQLRKQNDDISSTKMIEVTPIKAPIIRKRKLESLTYSPQLNKHSYSDFSDIDTGYSSTVSNNKNIGFSSTVLSNTDTSFSKINDENASNNELKRKFTFKSGIEITRLKKQVLSKPVNKQYEQQSNKIDSYFRPYKQLRDSISYNPVKNNEEKDLLTELFESEFENSIVDLEMGIRNSPDFKKTNSYRLNQPSLISSKPNTSSYFNNISNQQEINKDNQISNKRKFNENLEENSDLIRNELKKFEKTSVKKWKFRNWNEELNKKDNEIVDLNVNKSNYGLQFIKDSSKWPEVIKSVIQQGYSIVSPSLD